MFQLELVGGGVAASCGHFDLHFDFSGLVGRCENQLVGIEAFDGILAIEQVARGHLAFALVGKREDERGLACQAQVATLEVEDNVGDVFLNAGNR